ncbi:MAG: hypothetical protein ACKOH7_01280, partial [Solirubrobacterales bacterium]
RYIEDPLADFVLREELTEGATVMVDVAPEDSDEDVILTVVESKVPAAVGAPEDEPGEEDGDETPASDEPDES